MDHIYDPIFVHLEISQKLPLLSTFSLKRPNFASHLGMTKVGQLFSLAACIGLISILIIYTYVLNLKPLIEAPICLWITLYKLVFWKK